MFTVFPFLFRKRHPRSLNGIAEIVTKIKEMGLAHIISFSTRPKAINSEPKEGNLSDTDNWWYLG